MGDTRNFRIISNLARFTFWKKRIFTSYFYKTQVWDLIFANRAAYHNHRGRVYFNGFADSSRIKSKIPHKTELVPRSYRTPPLYEYIWMKSITHISLINVDLLDGQFFPDKKSPVSARIATALLICTVQLRHSVRKFSWMYARKKDNNRITGCSGGQIAQARHSRECRVQY